MSANVEVGRFIVGLRKAVGWTQETLAERVGAVLGKTVDPTTITRLEGGKRPKSERARAVEAAVREYDIAAAKVRELQWVPDAP